MLFDWGLYNECPPTWVSTGGDKLTEIKSDQCRKPRCRLLRINSSMESCREQYAMHITRSQPRCMHRTGIRYGEALDDRFGSNLPSLGTSMTVKEAVEVKSIKV